MEKEENTVTITATPNGPFDCRRPIQTGGQRRQGGNERKPDSPLPLRTLLQATFCDGTHRKIHYNDLSLKKIEKSI